MFQEKRRWNHQLKNINFLKEKDYSLLVLDGIENPGNLGAIFRTSLAIGFDMIILSNIKTYIFNPNVIRCSLGYVFSINIYIENKINCVIKWLKKNKFQIFTTGCNQKSTNLYKCQFTHSKIALVLGSENKGLSHIWFRESHKVLHIPMFGYIDSLNVSNAMSIIGYEIMRQRNYL
ncbi:TrmH family RNA methyltransferase [Blattabacterium cuenoti]|uniref:TrmH family RNA methyltransferase n=1 Tax=Blattabacterium cuenoti TaxID=1653831 RepID=UPI001CC22842|nr:TrmH family RNA methyltransferase [Blattabacterium cuenoti]